MLNIFRVRGLSIYFNILHVACMNYGFFEIALYCICSIELLVSMPSRQEVIFYLVSRIYALKRCDGFTRKLLMKILFKLSRRLPCGNPVRKHLQYYWYLYGPQSDDVLDAINVMRENKWLVTRRTIYGNPYLAISNQMPDFSSIEGFDKKLIDVLLSEILEYVDVCHPNKFYDSIYEEDAPVKFITLFGSRFIKTLEYNQHVDFVSLIPDLREVLIKCEEAIPSDPLFNDYRYIFSNYVISVERAFEHIEREPSSSVLSWYIHEVAEDVWKGFVFGNMTRPGCYDEDYESQVIEWRERYYKYLKEVESRVDSFYDFIFNIVKDECEYNLPDNNSKELLTSIVNNYLNY